MGTEMEGLEKQAKAYNSKINRQLDQLLTKLDQAAASLTGISNAGKKAAGNISRANKSAGRLQRTILGFDQIHALQGSDRKGGPSGGGPGGMGIPGGAGTALADYESAWKGMLEISLKAAQEYAAKTSTVFDGMWEYLKKGSYELQGSFTAASSQEVSVKIGLDLDWELIIKAIGDGVKKIGDTFNLYFSGMDWTIAGQAVAAGIMGMVSGINLQAAFQAIGSWIVQIPVMICGAVAALDWSAVGTSIGMALNEVLLKFDGASVSDGVNGIVTTLLSLLADFIKAAYMDDIVAAIGPKLKILGDAVSGLLKGGGLFSNVSIGAVAGIVAGIAAVVLGIIDLWNTSETFRENVTAMWDIICTAFENAKVRIWDEGLKPLWESLKELFASLYQLYEESGLKDIFETVVTGIGYIVTVVLAGLIEGISWVVQFIANGIQKVVEVLTFLIDGFLWVKDNIGEVWDWITQKFQQFQEFLGNIFATDWSEKFGWFGEIINGFLTNVESVFGGVQRIFGGLIDFVAGIFTGDWSRAWNGIKEIFGGIWDSFVAIVKSPINLIIGFINGLVSGFAKGINAIIRALNKLRINIPDNPLTGKVSIGFNIPTWTPPKIPYLAGGGLLENRGQLFLARENGPELVGSYGARTAVMNNNQIVESVADGVKRAVVEAMVMTGANPAEGQQVIVTLQGEAGQIFRVVQKEAKKYKRNYLRSAFE